jgi:hypothetical protein
MANDAATKALVQARDALRTQKVDVERALRDVERLLTQLGADGSNDTNGAGNDEAIPTVREAILDYLREQPKVPRRVLAIHKRVESRGVSVSDASLRSTLAKMLKVGIVANPKRGYYRLPKEQWPAEL